MRSLTIFALALIAFATAALAQAPDTAWTRTIVGPEYVSAVTVGPSSEIVTAGASYGRATWRKWDEAGSCIDSNLAVTQSFYGNVTDLWAIALCADGSGDYILAGRAEDFGQPNYPLLPFAVRVSSGGEMVWQRTYGCPSGDLSGAVSSVIPRQDGSAILFGGGVDYRVAAMAVDVYGDPIWCNSYPVYGDPSNRRGACITGMPDGGAIISGANTLAVDTGTVRIDSWGEIVWGNRTQFSRSVTLHPDTILCAAHYGPRLHIFKMTGSGDTVWTESRLNRTCLQLKAEPNGGWSIIGSDASGFDWIGRFNADGTMLWSGHYPIYIHSGVRLGHADYAFVDLINRKVMKTESGPRGNPTNLTILPGWPDPGYARLSWKGAEWRFYQIYGSSSPDGPFDQWQGQTDDTSFLITTDSDLKFYRVIGTDDPN